MRSLADGPTLPFGSYTLDRNRLSNWYAGMHQMFEKQSKAIVNKDEALIDLYNLVHTFHYITL